MEKSTQPAGEGNDANRTQHYEQVQEVGPDADLGIRKVDTETGKEELPDLMMVDTERAPEARGKLVKDLPRAYWISKEFLGSYFAILISAAAGIAGFSMVTPVLGVINNDLGPSNDINWVPIIWIVVQSLASLLCGRLSDVFGRRWIFIIGQILGLVGSIIGCRATSVQQVIGASAILGIAGGTGLSFFWTVGEIVPMKYRYIAIGTICGLCFTSSLGPKFATELVDNYSTGWRGVYYLIAALHGASIIAWYFFYHPPSFKMLHRRSALRDLLLTFDWVGLIIYTASIIVLLMGIQWGGGIYSWKSPQVIGSIAGGGAGLLLLVLWEWWMPLESSNPFLPLHLFRNLPFMAVTLLSSCGACAYYGLSFIWPAAVLTIYTNLSPGYVSTIVGLVPLCILNAQFLAGFIATYAVRPKLLVIGAMIIATPLITLAALDPINLHLTMGTVISGCFVIGIMEGLALTMTTMPLATQEEIGTAGGLSGTIRAFCSSVSIAIYAAVLKSRLSVTIPQNVIPAAENAGLPSSSITKLLSGLSGASPINETEGITPQILEAAQQAWRVAHAQGYRTVFLTSLAFSLPGIICVWFILEAPVSRGNFIAAHIHKSKETDALERQEC